MTIPSCFENNFSIEDIVCLSHKAASHEMGPAGSEYEGYQWLGNWAPVMDNFIGKQFKIEKISYDENGFRVAIICEPQFECTESRRWYLPPWCLTYPNESFGSKKKEFEKGELDLIAKFVDYQLREKKKKILADLSVKECGMMDLLVQTSAAINTNINLYWKTKLFNSSVDKNRILSEYCKKIEGLSNVAAIRDLSQQVRTGIEISSGNHKSLEKEIHLETLAVLNRFVNSDIYQSKVPASGLEDIILRIVTDPITLEFNDTEKKKVFKEDFGPMEIHFSMMAQTIKVIAQKPNYDEHTGSRFFHPHVNGSGNVCEGEGRGPISNAIKDGRFVDLFDLVIGILETYNPVSPYCHMRNWHPPKSKCSNCGDLILERNLTTCGKCRKFLCISCKRECNCCDSYRCPTCISYCKKCKANFCDTTSCLERHSICVECNETICFYKDKIVKYPAVRGNLYVTVHETCCRTVNGNWVRKSMSFHCVDCNKNYLNTAKRKCMCCEKEICAHCFESDGGCCKECNEQIKQEEIEAFRLADERRLAEEATSTREEGSIAVEETTSEAATGSGDGIVRDESETEEQGEANVSA